MQFIKNFIQEEDGVTAIEYALIAAVVAGIIAAAFGLLEDGINGVFTTIADKLKAATA
ncbi:Flp family type IVb pilin [Pseudoduganella sp. SL102]|uniref:Flp family type IVb pilin n=1 Tax=Pseudoduganella sp. SL102 TaxID=2995154 RepID=UPI00248C664C|nr:Flp family type IVb pilin [Pseudoduganella sp. SL102]WBS04874.1 Flp family type IVb pilin [Pseudoduganella sp. SL102]